MSSGENRQFMFAAFADCERTENKSEESEVVYTNDWIEDRSSAALRLNVELEKKSCDDNSVDEEPRRKKKKKKEKKSKHKKEKKRSPTPKKEDPKDYFKDFIPDRNTLQYGCLYEKHVPKYKRSSSYVLGIRKKHIYPPSKIERYHLKRIRKQIKKEGESIKLDKGFRFVGQDFIGFSKWECYEEKIQEPFDNIRNLEYLVQKDPSDIESWFKLAAAHSQNQAVLNEDAKLDMMESVLKRAKEKNPANVDILIYYINRRKTVDDQEWKKILFNHVNDERIWKAYLEYHVYRQMSFTIRNTAIVFAKCMKDFRRTIEGHVVTHLPRKDAAKHLLSFFAMYCSILKRSGSSERAISTWQAFIELNFNCPEKLIESALNTQLYSLDEFWDSGLPRFGEKHSVGWKNSTNQKVVQTQPTLNEDKVVQKYIDQGESRVWLALEKLRENSHFLSCRRDNEVDDYERIILFDDVKDFLFRSSEHRAILDLLEEFFEISSSTYDLIISEIDFKMAPVNSWMSGLAEQILEQIATVLENSNIELFNYWIEKWFGYLLRIKDKKSVKKAKSILGMSSCKSNPLFWAKLAQLLSKHTRRKEAEEVINQTKSNCVKCCIIYAEIYLGFQGGDINFEKARNSLAVVVDIDRVFTNFDILRVKTAFEERMMKVLSPHLDIAYSLFLYSIEYTKVAFDFLENRLKVYEKDKDNLRMIIEIRIKLSQHYLSSDRTAPPKLLNTCVFEAIKLFPEVIEYHSALIKLKNDRILRGFLDNLITDKKYNEIDVIHVTRALIEIRADNIERTFSVLEEGVSKCPRSTILWRMLMYWTAKTKSSEHVERVFHRSLISCVPDKILYTDFVLLAPKNVQLVTDLLTEKLMRIRTPLDEVRVLIE